MMTLSNPNIIRKPLQDKLFCPRLTRWCVYELPSLHLDSYFNQDVLSKLFEANFTVAVNIELNGTSDIL